MVYIIPLNWPPIRADALGYYAYLPAAFIYRNISMEKMIKVHVGSDKSFYTKAESWSWFGISRYPETGKYLDKYPLGAALMMVPFFLLAHGLTLGLGQPADGFSLLYQSLVSMGGGVLYDLWFVFHKESAG